jgi:exodeoxyribonuclease-5
MLTEIHRQAAENPILYLADKIRRGGALPRPGYKAGDALRIIADDGNERDYDVTLVGLNDTRHWQNRRHRACKGFASLAERDVLPKPNETLVCTHNDYSVSDPIYNGECWRVVEAAQVGDDLPILELELFNDYGTTNVRVPVECFTEQRFESFSGLQQFDFGYALTVHKAQGSEFDSVRLFNESRFFRQDARRWLYTGIARARERLTIVDYS